MNWRFWIFVGRIAKRFGFVLITASDTIEEAFGLDGWVRRRLTGKVRRELWRKSSWEKYCREANRRRA